MNDVELLDGLQEKIKENAPGFEIRYKNEDKLMKLLDKILFFNKSFMTNFVTTFKEKVYWTDLNKFKEFPLSSFFTLAHEYVHILDDKKEPVKYKLGYLFPQCLAIFSLLSFFAFFSKWFLLFLLFLLFVLPLPAPFRTKSELRGYGMSIKVRQWKFGKIHDDDFNRYVKQFTSGNYYYMFPFKNYIRKELEKWKNSDECLNDKNTAYKDVYNLIQESKKIK